MSSETRSAPRKALRAHARVVLPGAAPLRAKTIDVSMGGVSIIVAEQIPVGQKCTVAFEAPFNGTMVRVVAVARIVYSILKGTDGYRTGMQFVEIDEANNRALAGLMF
ncbi:MAG TPA: PilZ domain-containing protein [Noviherbaspirillum sp.]|nr:PilZ domain-containing protein [Noviherbaspirillum sp.]